MDAIVERWTRIDLKLGGSSVARKAIRRFVRGLASATDGGGVVKDPLLKGLRGQTKSKVLASLYVLEDLALQGWQLRVTTKAIEILAPLSNGADPNAEKVRVQQQEKRKRDEQLMIPSVRTFITGMEAPRLHRGRWISIASLMRDGESLAAALAQIEPTEAAVRELRTVVDPYLQIVTPQKRCESTGLRLNDIWRYFRHTWSSQYSSTPGRTMMYLIRDRAVADHPVIGIGALGSSIVQMAQRDKWIGWDAASFTESALKEPTDKTARWLAETCDAAVKELYVADLLQRKLLKRNELLQPTSDSIKKLRQFGKKERALHHRFVRSTDHKSQNGSGSASFWKRRAQSHLFRSKRALTLATLLEARVLVQRYMGIKASGDGLRELLASPNGRWAVHAILRKAKADRIGIAMADITVCGAIPPYNPLLGGKLVSALSASPEVIDGYRRRYKNSVSEIASAMAGRRIVRPSNLVLLCTTSLYGSGSSQYNRLRVPARFLGGAPHEHLAFTELGRSRSFGTSQFREQTVQALVRVMERSKNGQRVNSIFGEGVSPKFRKMREGLDYLGFPADVLLQHGRQRLIYGIPLAANMRPYLLGMDRRPQYLFSIHGRQATEAIRDWWTERWLLRRIQRPDVIAAVAAHSSKQPLEHGARVQLPGSVSLNPLAQAVEESDLGTLDAS